MRIIRAENRPVMIDRELLNLLPTIGVEAFAIMVLLTDQSHTMKELAELSGLQDYHVEVYVESLRKNGLAVTDDNEIAPPEITVLPSQPERLQPGYVYLIKSSTGYWKIGHSKTPENRMKTFGVMLPFEVEYEHLIPTTNMFMAETILHTKFSDKRVRGEWFSLTDDDVIAIKAIERM